MSLTGLPLQLFFQKSTSFCNSVNTDLDELIQFAENQFSSVSREVKITPKLSRKSRLIDFPGSCTLDLKQFTRSKESALRNLKTKFECMEKKWACDVAELRNWFLTNAETCLSKVQLEIKVTAEDLNLPKHVYESDLQEEKLSSSSEASFLTAAQQSGRQIHSFSTPVRSKTSRNTAQQTTSLYHSFTPSVTSAVNKTAKRTSKAQSSKAISLTEPVLQQSKKTEWMSLLGSIEKAPSKPGIYEVKVCRAKKPAFIGHSDDLQQTFVQYREGIFSREKQKKQLNLFIQRNKEEISVRYVPFPSAQSAKYEQKKRLKEFLEKNKNLPSYNYGL